MEPKTALLLEWACAHWPVVWAHTGTTGDDGLLREGAAMLVSLAGAWQGAGLRVETAAADPTVANRLRRTGLFERVIPLSTGEGPSATLDAWEEATRAADFVCVIAPELDGILESAIGHLAGRHRRRLLNCTAPMLTVASDKWLTAQALERCQIPHPPTLPLAQVRAAWIAEHAAASEAGSAGKGWVIKRRDGAGADSIRRVPTDRLLRTVDSARSWEGLSVLDPAGWIVQRWVDGQPASCSGIIDGTGRVRWFPPLFQKFETSPDGLAPRAYRGGRTIEITQSEWEQLQVLLDRTVEALGPGSLGWIGIDLIFLPQSRRWCVVEINPRCTSSLVGWMATAPDAVAWGWQSALATFGIPGSEAVAPDRWPRSIADWPMADFTV